MQIFPEGPKIRDLSEFEILDTLGAGTYGTIFKAREIKTNTIYALKKMTLTSGQCGFHLTSLREINLLSRLQHRNIVGFGGVCISTGNRSNSNNLNNAIKTETSSGKKTNEVFLILEYCEYDLSRLLEVPLPMEHSDYTISLPLGGGMDRNRYGRKGYTPAETKTIILHVLSALAYMHDSNVIHRDLKLSNLLVSSKGHVKVADFGLSRMFGTPVDAAISPQMVTLWYRPPEILLDLEYDSGVDIWSVGCVFAELLLQKPLFSGTTTPHQLQLIRRVLGPPTVSIWPQYSAVVSQMMTGTPVGYSKDVELDTIYGDDAHDHKLNLLSNYFSDLLSPNGIDLLQQMLTYNPSQRITAHQALRHPWFYEAPRALSSLPVMKTKIMNKEYIK